ncbi:hypothetical protein [Clostridium folliculivorans]|uniref:Uncharacterized protein n=1 Tax=Clostridium folliculivorans TaxID=2886038 RepID=A0A9W5XYZ1_9CLOT|nr:hypothetical protein [Clostridium folliculivorans]GKU23515.1 hypothetical protein CFOLD11_03410 [Clostridium folliculivorans]GKU29631.1 hypothetical protein CFB3_17380 [Clostridium folliculivorans]
MRNKNIREVQGLYELACKYNIKYLLDSSYFKINPEYDLYEKE